MIAVRNLLEQWYQEFHRESYLQSDPLEYLHRYRDPWDQEVVAIVSALVAYGRVKQIRASIEDFLSRISQVSAIVPTSPAEVVRSLSNPQAISKVREALAGWTHRFNTGSDLLRLLQVIEQSWREYGSVGAHFVTHLKVDAIHVGDALNCLIRDWAAWDQSRGVSLVDEGSFGYFLSAPEKGSCCKRWCMLLRWMGRKDELDPGLWQAGSPLLQRHNRGPKLGLRPDQVVFPLDTHTGRLSLRLGLTRRKSLDWKAAEQVTAALKEWDPLDPTRYDFVLSRIGILDLYERVPQGGLK